MSVSRRDVLLLGGLGALGAAGLAVPLSSIAGKSASELARANMPVPFRAGFRIPPVLEPFLTDIDPADGAPVNHYLITERVGVENFLPDLPTPVLGYNGIFPGPTISLERGTHAVVTMRNQLSSPQPFLGTPTATSTHLHGSPSLPQFDGYASDVSQPGFRKDYHYPNTHAAVTFWYHDHAVHFTAQNVYSGLAAMYEIHDPAERELLPQGEFDVPLIVNDFMFAADGTEAYDDHSQSGLFGDVLLVNGRPWPVMPVKRRVYRFRCLNASINRSIRPALSTGEPLVIVATDDGLMPRSRPVGSYRHANAERYEFLIDFSQYPAGRRVELLNLSNPHNIDFDGTDKIMAFDVTDEPFEGDGTNRIPDLLVNTPEMELDPAQAVRTRHLRFERQGGDWTINGETWQDVIASNFQHAIANPGLDDIEIWELENKSGGWFHPVHIHLIDFKILSRNGQPPFPWERGPKDVVYLGENETVRLITHFGPHRGRYMIHCHNLPHEDHDMMVQFRVGLQEGEPDPNDPIKAARPVFDSPVP
ncbi:multicopper oxidase family protein [Arthrobacter cavernae]|uniref:Multicopper oxidase domain-containing protein n=1 Tax=Arthrobacter cavernae TaxID=2817681 RepID=A0A939HKM6_9MICC|nr:multicopper oxidase domain-containing protein [Arthrobacter cavernae]MBO1269898.1 multicopper oxidase domain-containing protein [Arthrobacter cavernae]